MQTRSQIKHIATKTKEFQKACKCGDTMLAQDILMECPKLDISADNELAFNSACFGGHLEIAKWLLSIKPDIDTCICNYEAYRFACGNGHINIAIWYHTTHETIPRSIMMMAFNLAYKKNMTHITHFINQHLAILDGYDPM